MEFKRRKVEAERLDPRDGFRPVRAVVEVRWDPLTGQTSRLLAPRDLLPPGVREPEEVGTADREDCPFCPERLEHPTVVRELYAIAIEAIDAERKIWRTFLVSPDAVLNRSVQVLEMFVPHLRRLREIADREREAFASDGFRRLFAMLSRELQEDYLRTVEGHLRELRFRRGLLMSAELGPGNKGTNYVLRKVPPQSWMDRVLPARRSGYSFQVAERDESGHRALAELRGRGVNPVAAALAQAADHILGFFVMLRTELAFYVGCLNLHRQLTAKGQPTCFPHPLPPSRPALAARALYDVCLSLSVEARVVGNDVDGRGRRLVVITGANQGGKSTFLRSVGLGQLMMQAGMFVGAESFRADVCPAVFTHYKREEDPTMQSGKLDEELARMSAIADRLTPGCLLLCNESFASTNEPRRASYWAACPSWSRSAPHWP